MLKLLLFHSSGCGFCKAAISRLKLLVPEDRVVFKNVRGKKLTELDKKALKYGLPCLFITHQNPTNGLLILGTNPDDGEPVKFRGYKEPGFTNFIGEQFYGIENLDGEIRSGNATKGRLLKALASYDEEIRISTLPRKGSEGDGAQKSA